MRERELRNSSASAALKYGCPPPPPLSIYSISRPLLSLFDRSMATTTTTFRRCFHRFLLANHPTIHPSIHRTISDAFSDACRSCSSSSSFVTCTSSNALHLFPPSTKVNEQSSILRNFIRPMSSQGKAPSQQARKGALKITMLSPGFIFEPYKPREPFPFWRRWFTLKGWRRTKEDIIMELKSAYAIAQLRKQVGYSKKQFYQESIKLYTDINLLLANGDKSSLRKLVTENMFSALKNDLKRRESMWKSVYWELILPVVSVRTLRARMIGVDKNDIRKSFIQLTVEFLTKQKIEAYDSNGRVISGDKNKEVLVRDIWVFERSFFHPDAHWRVCGRLTT